MTKKPPSGVSSVQARIDPTVPNPARLWNYLLGGKDNYAVDREIAAQILARFPQLRDIARADRAFLARAVTYLTQEAGVSQFLDIGTGLPTAENTHEVAQRVDPGSRVVYVDNDPVVLAHARALLEGTSHGATAYIDAHAQNPDEILDEASKTLDFSQPVAVMMLGVLEYVPESDRPHDLVRRYLAALPSGSHLVVAHGAPIGGSASGDSEAVALWHDSGAAPLMLRFRDSILTFFDGLELVPPGLVSCSQWRAEHEGDSVSKLAAVGRKP